MKSDIRKKTKENVPTKVSVVEQTSRKNSKTTNFLLKELKFPKINFLKKLWQKIIVFGILGTIFLIILMLTGFEIYYRNKVYPRVYVLGVSVGGKDKKELEKIINEKIKQPVVLKINSKQVSFSSSQAGIYYNKEETIKKTIEFGRQKNPLTNGNLQLKIKALFGKYEITPVFNFNKDQFNKFAADISQKYNIPAQKASLTVVGEEIKINPSSYASEIALKKLENQIKEEAKQLFKNPIVVSFNQVPPPILEDQLKEAKQLAENWIKVLIILKKESKSYIPSNITKGNWLNFPEIEVEGKPKVIAQLDSEKIKSYLATIGSEINIPAQDRKVTIENGTVETVTEEGKEGSAMDTTTIISDIIWTFDNKKESLVMEIPMVTVVPQTIITRTVTYDWNKYILVDLSDQVLFAYENGIEVFRTYVSTGTYYYPTPPGTYSIYNKSESVLMEGGTPGIDYYYLPNVPWVSWFHNGYSIHGTYWHNNFGYPMSHGCVNASIPDALWIYNWAPIGTPVVVQY